MKNSLKNIGVKIAFSIICITSISCSVAKKTFKEQGYEYEKRISEISKTKITGKYIEVGAIGLAKTHDTAKSIGSLKGKSAAAEVLGTLIKVSNGEKVENSLIADSDMDVSTKEIYDAVRTVSSEALLTGAYVTEVHFGRAHDGSGRIMAAVRVRVPLKNSESKLQ